MDNKTLMITLGAAVVVGGIGLSLYDANQGSAQFDRPAVFPELASKAAAVDRIKIESAGNHLVVESHKEGGKWLIDNLGGYVANVESLSRLINNLKDAKRLEAKTAKPELFHHLGLTDVANEQSKALLVTLSTKDKQFRLLVGDSAKNGRGQYVRIDGENQSWLIDKSLNKPEKAEDWVDTKLFDFELKDIQSVSLNGRFQYSLTKKDKAQKHFTLDVVPEGQQLKYDAIVDAVPRAVAGLKFDSLKPVSKYQAGDEPQSVAVKLFDKDGEIKLTLSKSDDKYYARLSGDNPLWDKWAYQVSEYNYNQLIKDKKDYLKAVEKPQNEAKDKVIAKSPSAPDSGKK